MNKFKRIISVILTASLFLLSFTSITFADGEAGFSENFTSMEAGSTPTEFDVLSGSGTISVKERESNKYVEIENDNDGSYVTLSRTFEELLGTVTAQTDFRQSGVKSDGNVIMQLLNGSTLVCSVETSGGNIIYKGSTEDTVIKSNYSVDTQYRIHLEVNLDTGNVEIYLGDTLVKSDAKVLASSAKLNTFRAYSFMSPGFELDNISVSKSSVITSASLDGADTQSIPPSGESAVYEYSAAATTAEGIVQNASFDFAIEGGAPAGVSIQAVDGETVKITVADTATPDTEYKLVATLSTNASVKAEKTITLKEAVYDEIKIEGKGSISLALTKKGETFQYTAKVLDEFGNEMAGKAVDWSISGEGASYVSIDQTGKLAVINPSDVSSQIELKASLRGDSTKFAIRKIMLTDVRTYLSDETRRNVLKEYMDTALEYGKDIYNGSPRIADGINRDGEAIKWRVQSGDEVPLADMGNEWELLRTMIAYSETGGDPFYKERAEELYKYTMENDIEPTSGLVYWGSHKAIDLRTGRRTGDASTGIGIFHEIELKDMYLTPFYETDEEKTAKMVRDIWMGHVTDWSNLMFNRHGNYNQSHNKALTWDDLSQYDDLYYEKDAFVRDYDGCTFLIAASEYISAAVELYERTGDEKALIWAKRMADRYANLADKKTGIMPSLYATPYGDSRITDEDGNLSTNIRPKYVDYLATCPYSLQTANYGDRVYVQFAEDMAAKGLLDGIEVTDHIDLPTGSEENEKIADLIRNDGAKALILEMYYNRYWPSAYGNSIFAIAELCETLGLEGGDGTGDKNAGFPLFAKWMHGYKSYIDLAYEGNSRIGVSFACGIKLDKYVTAVPGYTSAKGSMLDSESIGLGTIVPAVEMIFILDRFDDSVSVYEEAGNPAATVTVGDVKKTLWDFINSMADYYGIGYLGEPTEGINPEPDFHTSCSDENALNAIIEIYRNTGTTDYLELARIIANNIVETNYDGGLFAPSSQYGTWTTSHAAAVIMKLDAVINDVWSDALDFSFASYVYHQAYYINEHGKIPVEQHETRHTESYNSVKPRKIKVDKTAIAMNIGDVQNVNVTVLPDDADSRSYYWEISDESIIKIDADNNIYAVGRGEVTVRAVVEDTAIESEDIHIIVE